VPPRVSVLIPTLNAARTLDACLCAIRAQQYPADRIEIILADAGSTDDTRAIAARHRVDAIIENPLKTGEAGKAAAARVASGEVLALIDSDNLPPDPDWLTRMTAPFADPRILATEPLAYTRRDTDPALTRYFAMLGMNDPLCLFIGNYDRQCALTGTWTGLDVPTEDCGDWLALRLRADHPLPTIGANGFLIRRRALDGVSWHPYWFDVDVVRDITRAAPGGVVHMAKVKTGIVHLYCDTLDAFARKQERRVRDFLFFRADRRRPPIRGERRRLLVGIALFTLATLTGLPLLIQRRRGNRRVPDPAWRLHGPVCRITLRTYALNGLRKCLGIQQTPAPRQNWRQ